MRTLTDRARCAAMPQARPNLHHHRLKSLSRLVTLREKPGRVDRSSASVAIRPSCSSLLLTFRSLCPAGPGIMSDYFWMPNSYCSLREERIAGQDSEEQTPLDSCLVSQRMGFECDSTTWQISVSCLAEALVSCNCDSVASKQSYRF